MFRLFECCALSFFERFVLSFSLKIERFVSDSAEIWICGLYIDMRRLLQLVRKETIIPRDLLDELEVWGNKLLELEAGELHAVPQDDIVMHFEEGFPVTFRRVGDKLMVNATQITMHFGKIPSEWLRIASTDMLRREMAGNGHTGKYESQVFTTRILSSIQIGRAHV